MAVATLEREQTAREEKISFGRGENIGLQARLILGGDFLIPAKEYKNEVKVDLLEVTWKTYSPVQKLSQLERAQAWKNKEGNDFQKQKEAWAQAVADVVEKKKDFFDFDEKGKRWKDLYGRLGVDSDHFNKDEALLVYDLFFDGNRRGQEVERFTNDIISLDIYQNPDKTVNFAKVKADLDAFEWLGNIFGKGSSLIATELIAAEARILDKTEKQKFVDEINREKGLVNKKKRIDRLNEYETALLNYVNTADKEGKLEVPRSLEKYLKSTDTIGIPSAVNVFPVAPPLGPVHTAPAPTTNGSVTPIEVSSTNGSDAESSDGSTGDQKEEHSAKLPITESSEPEIPVDFIGRINYELKRGFTTIPAPLEPVVEYLKQIRDKDGNGIGDIRAEIIDGNLLASGTVISPQYGEFGFSEAVYGNKGNKVALIKNPEIKLPEGLNTIERGLAPGKIKDNLKQLNNMIVVAMNKDLKRTNPGIEVESVQFERNRIRFTFKKR